MKIKMKQIKKILAANRSEIAIRIFRAAEESGIRTAAIYSKEDRFALHRYKTDESYLLKNNKGPIQAYLDIDSIIKIAKEAEVDAIHPGYGFLSESPEFAEACNSIGIIFIGPTPEILSKLGNKTENGKLMFVYQAFEAFKLWHGIEPQINNEVLEILNND